MLASGSGMTRMHRPMRVFYQAKELNDGALGQAGSADKPKPSESFHSDDPWAEIQRLEAGESDDTSSVTASHSVCLAAKSHMPTMK